MSIESLFPGPSSIAWGFYSRAQAERTPLQIEGGGEAKKENAIKANLLDANPLLFPPLLQNPEHFSVLREVTLDHIRAIGGLEPTKFESAMVESLTVGSSTKEQRIIVRFELDKISDEQITMLEELTRKTYGVTVRTTTTSDGKPVPFEGYPPTSFNEAQDYSKRSIIMGWYMGPNLSATDSLHQGIYFYKDLGDITRATLISGERGEEKFIVEVREASLTQVNLIMLIVQVSSILGKAELIDRKDLSYSIYHDLVEPSLRVNLVDRAYGTEKIRAQIRRALFLPLGNPELAAELGLEAESVIQIGAYGTGKTWNSLSFMLEDTGSFVVPVDPDKLVQDLKSEISLQKILPALDRVYSETDRSIVLLIDEVEKITSENSSNAALLNLLAGVRRRGVFILASTNQPEKIDPAFFQPQRFGVVIHTGIQTPEANIHILNLHTPATHGEEESLFRSEKEKQIVLEEIASMAKDFPPRQLAAICTQAKINLLGRIAEARGRSTGLTSDDLANFTFTVQDWVEAFQEVSSSFNAKAIKERDEKLSRFVAARSRHIGFSPYHDESDGLIRRISERVESASQNESSELA